jgi:hypothetical protein
MLSPFLERQPPVPNEGAPGPIGLYRGQNMVVEVRTKNSAGYKNGKTENNLIPQCGYVKKNI